MAALIGRRAFMARTAAVAAGFALADGITSLGGTPADAATDAAASTSSPAASTGVASGSSAIGSTGIYAPSDWGQNGGWYTARAAAGSRRVKVVSFGDSISLGFCSSSWSTKGYFGKLALDLQSLYGDGGSGAQSVAAATSTGGANTPTASGSGGTVGGFDVLQCGLNNYALFPSSPGSGATLTFRNVRGNTIEIVNYPTTWAGTMTVSIDGGAPTSISATNGGAGVAMGLTSIPTTSGTHTVVVAFTSGTALLADVRGLNATGIVPFGMNRAGRVSKEVGITSSLSSGPTTGALSIEALAPDLFIYELGINDIAAGTSASVFAANVAYALDYARAGNPLCDIIIVAPHRGSMPDSGQLYPQYLTELRGIAEGYGAMMVNFWSKGRTSWNYWNQSGYWGDDTFDGLAGPDPVHPSDAGYAYMESILLPLVTGN